MDRRGGTVMEEEGFIQRMVSEGSGMGLGERERRAGGGSRGTGLAGRNKGAACGRMVDWTRSCFLCLFF